MKPWGALICLIVLPALASGQSLGDAAKKERDRRERLRKGGVSTQTLTEEDLATTKGTLANDPKAQPAKVEEDQTSKRGPRQARLDAVPSNGGEQYWRGRAAQARGRVEMAERRSADLERMIRIGQAGHYDSNGRRVIYSIYQMKAMADAAAAELAATRKALDDLIEEGRRAGAQPGWFR